MDTSTYTLTFKQAADLLTAAGCRDALNGRGGVALTDDLRGQYTIQLAAAEGNVPTALRRAARTAVAARDPKATMATAMLAWLGEQNITS